MKKHGKSINFKEFKAIAFNSFGENKEIEELKYNRYKQNKEYNNKMNINNKYINQIEEIEENNLKMNNSKDSCEIKELRDEIKYILNKYYYYLTYISCFNS